MLFQRQARAHSEAGQHFIAAPVLGRPEAAAKAQLFIIAGGPGGTAKRVQPLLEAMGQRIFHISERPQDASLVKLSGNFLIASVMEALGEAMALIGKAGIDKGAYLDVLTSTLFSAPVYKTYGKLIASGSFEPAGFAASLGAKDIRLTLAAGEALSAPMPIASLLRDRFITLLAHNGEKLDWSAIGSLPGRDSGA